MEMYDMLCNVQFEIQPLRIGIAALTLTEM